MAKNECKELLTLPKSETNCFDPWTRHTLLRIPQMASAQLRISTLIAFCSLTTSTTIRSMHFNCSSRRMRETIAPPAQWISSVRVRSCWGGIAAFDASIFQPSPALESRCELDTNCLPLRFRGSNESFWEASECCLIYADMEEQYGPSDRVFINPYVRVAYTKRNFGLIPLFRRFERFFEHIQYFRSRSWYPNINPRRTNEPAQWVDDIVWQDGLVETSSFRKQKESTSRNVTASRGRWSTVRRQAGVGGFCGERTMFVMKGDLEEINENI
jgi:hypothetical protein